MTENHKIAGQQVTGHCRKYNEAQIVRWIRVTQDETGHRLRRTDPVYDEDENGVRFIVPKTSWDSLNHLMGRGLVQMDNPEVRSITQLRKKHALNDDHTEEQIIRWALLFREKEKRLPTYTDKVVWDRDRNGEWIQVEGESWTAIGAALDAAHRGLHTVKGASSLSELLCKHGLRESRQKPPVRAKAPVAGKAAGSEIMP